MQKGTMKIWYQICIYIFEKKKKIGARKNNRAQGQPLQLTGIEYTSTLYSP